MIMKDSDGTMELLKELNDYIRNHIHGTLKKMSNQLGDENLIRVSKELLLTGKRDTFYNIHISKFFIFCFYQLIYIKFHLFTTI